MNGLRGLTNCRFKNLVFIVLFTVILLPISSYSAARTVAKDGSGDYTNISTALSASGDVDTVILVGSVNDTFTMDNINYNNFNTYIKNNKQLFITSNQTDPDSFPVFARSGNHDYYTIFMNFSMFFEKLVITTTNTFENGNSENTYSFRDCVIRDCNSDIFFEFKGSGKPQLIFENCLFTGNKTILKVHFWGVGEPYLRVNNCTIDNNDTVLVSQDMYTITDMLFSNCIFSNNKKTLPNSYFTQQISYSLTYEDITDYGENCVSDTNPMYTSEIREKPSDWIPQALSPAKEIGNLQTAPEFDIAGNPRTEIIDAGCWNGEPGGPPEIIAQPESDTLGAGQDAVFTVEVTGLKPFKFSWFKNGTDDPLDTSTSAVAINLLEIENITAESEGEYYCVIENDSGEITSDTVNLTVVARPVIDSIVPLELTVVEEDNAVFTVSASGGLLEYKWYENGEEIEDENGPVLSFVADLENDGNKYKCEVSNDSGSVESDEAALHVVAQIPVFTVHPGSTTVFEGAEVTFSVDATGKAPVIYEWFRTDSETQIGEGKTYTIQSALMTDSGIGFYCEASNSEGSVKSDTAILTVNTALNPVINSHPLDVEVREGYDARFSISATGSDLEFAWYKEGSDEILGDDSILELSSVELSDSGMYYCVVSNSAGEEQSDKAKLIVLSENEPFNPVKLSGDFVDRKTVLLTVEDFSDINTEEGEALYADTIGIWYEINKFPSEPDVSSPNLIKISIDDLKNNGPTDTYVLDESTEECFTYFFVASVFWHNPDTVTPFHTPNGTSIYMCSSDPIDNNLDIEGDYNTGDDSMVVTISNLESIDRDSISYLELWCESNENEYFREKILTDSLPDGNEMELVFKDSPMFSEDQKRITWKLSLTGVLGNISDIVREDFTVGIPRPQNLLVLEIDEVKSGYVKLAWQLEPDVIYDSIKVWYGTEQIPLTYNPPESEFEYMTIIGMEDGVTIEGLNENTHYCFGIQIRRNGFWSYITESSCGSATTEKNVDPEKVINSINLSEIKFDKNKNRIMVSWSIDTVGISQYDLQTGINWGIGAYPKTAPHSSDPIISFDKTKNTYDYEIDPGAAMLFDTLYHVSLWLRVKDRQWSDQSDDARDTVRIPPLEWQDVTYFENSDTINTFNRKVYMWMDPIWTALDKFENMLEIFEPDENPDGFIPVSIGVEFRDKMRSPKFHFGIKCDSLPSGYSISDVNIYQYDTDTDKWLVLEKTGVDPIKNILSIYIRPDEFPLPFILMVDTSKPEISVENDTTALNPMQSVETELNVQDNISNVKVEFWCGLGSEKLSLQSTMWGKEYDETFKFNIPAEKVTADNGVRALLVITDGVHTDTVNISRKVFRDASSDAISTVGGKWVPLVTTTDLYEPAIDSVLKDLHEDGSFKYDNTMFRIFRFSSTENNFLEGNTWIEYSDDPDLKPLFDLVPGRVLWIKTRDDATLRLGAGKTVTLKKPHKIEIKAKDWTDISLPFRFNVCMGDILEHSDINDEEWNSIWVYSWQENENAANLYSTPHYMPMIPDMDNPDIELNYSNDFELSYNVRQTYTVFNNLDRDVTLRIPSVPAIMSSYSESLGKKKVLSGWSVKINARTHDEILNPVICAYTPGKGRTYLKQGPGFGKVRLFVQNPENNSLWGHVINHELTDGGNVVPLVIENSSQSSQKLNLEIENGKSVPENMKVVFVNPENRKIQYLTEMEMGIEAGARKNGWLLAGDSIFIASWYKQIITTEFSLEKLFPNPCRGRLMVRFTIPYTDISEIKMMIFDQLGRRVWSKDINRRLQPGLNVVHCEIPASESFAAGTYIFNIKAIDHKGRVVGSQRSRLTYLP